MSKILILGAGASAASPNTRGPNLPLLKDIPAILLANAQWLGPFLQAVPENIELLLTHLHRLQVSFFDPEGLSHVEPKMIDAILSSGAVGDLFPEDQHALRSILGTLKKYAEEGPSNQGPGSVLGFIRAIIFSYLTHSTIIDRPCPLHERLFEMLGPRDVVVSFNYDEIADYALLYGGLLSDFSFVRLGFETISIPKQYGWHGRGNQFLKVHGSVNLDAKTGPPGPRALDPPVHYHLSLSTPRPGAVACSQSLLLPMLAKDSFYREVPMFSSHRRMFKDSLASSTEIWLVGKTFKNSDSELNALIRLATYGKEKTLHIVDPCTSDPEFNDFHCSLFHATLGSAHRGLRQYCRDTPARMGPGWGTPSLRSATPPGLG